MRYSEEHRIAPVRIAHSTLKPYVPQGFSAPAEALPGARPQASESVSLARLWKRRKTGRRSWAIAFRS